MCNPRNYSDTPPTSKSTVEELHEPIPSLFRALTEGDTQLNWNIVSFPVAEELSHHENLVSFLETVNQPHHQNVSVPSNNVHAPYSSDKGSYGQQLTFSKLPPHFLCGLWSLYEGYLFQVVFWFWVCILLTKLWILTIPHPWVDKEACQAYCHKSFILAVVEAIVGDRYMVLILMCVLDFLCFFHKIVTELLAYYSIAHHLVTFELSLEIRFSW